MTKSCAQFAKALAPIFVTFSPSSTALRFSQPKNASFPTSVKVSGNTISFKFLQPENAFAPIFTSPSGKISFSSVSLSFKNSSAISVTPSGTVISAADPLYAVKTPFSTTNSGNGSTVTWQEAVKPSTVAVITADPCVNALTVPLSSTEATSGALLDHTGAPVPGTFSGV